MANLIYFGLQYQSYRMSIGDKNTPAGNQKISQKTVINILTLFIILNAFFCAYLWISHSNLAQQFYRLKKSINIKNKRIQNQAPSSEYIYVTQQQNRLKSREELEEMIMGLIVKNQELQRRLQKVQKILYPPKIKYNQREIQLKVDQQIVQQQKKTDPIIDSIDKNIINEKEIKQNNEIKQLSLDSFDQKIDIFSQKSQDETKNTGNIQLIKQKIEDGIKSAVSGIGQTFLQIWSAFM